MAAHVLLTEDARQDLQHLHDWIATNDDPANAAYVLDQIEHALESLSENPLRGRYPRELVEVGLKEYREIFFKPYRIIYRVLESRVYVMVITDGRRDMQALLQRRLLR